MKEIRKSLPDIFRSIKINADIQKVWKAVSTAKGLSSWLMPCTIEAKLGNSFTMNREPMGEWDGTIHCVVKELDPPYKLGFSWSGNGLDHYITFKLKPDKDGTQFILIHSGWLEGTERIRETMYDGWGHILDGFKETQEVGDKLNETPRGK
ncbi:SRPBCC domain-containing protein [Clostridium sp. AL.422]|uniref:SRPBCC family protein n=1 Tax=Clostridium TaxID=1485 RepID=UPI00293DCC95|nr:MULTISPECIES: SRPBCC domain-containing protein [unclassified Clostridium]MDV4150898.1 SRPBCC domain-containing protein [Clostridium sp. AL.422]